MTRTEEVARRLAEFADLLEAKDVEYKPRAYRRAAESVSESPDPVEALARADEDRLTEIEHVGEAIASKIREYIETGEIEELEQLRSELPVEIDALTDVEGVGPKTVGTLYERLGVQTLEDLEAAAEAGDIRDISGFGRKTEQNILDGIDFARQSQRRQLLGAARPQGERIREYLTELDAVVRCALAGSIRRWKPTSGDVDVLAASEEPGTVVEKFTDFSEAGGVIESGTNKASIRISDVRVDLRVVDPGEFGAALQYFTGSKQHNVAVRNRAIERDLKVNEYGVFDVSGVEEEGQRVGRRVAGQAESEVYEAIGVAFIPPELRERRGELQAAAAGELPALLKRADVCGDLHVHTDWSDGGHAIEEMAREAAAFGHEYVAITDHATGPGMVGGTGITDEQIREQRQEIRAADDDSEIDLFAGIEANIDPDGGISVGDEVLAELDVVVASPHAALDGDGTDRLAKAARHPSVDIIGHPTGRYLNQRPGLDIDVERLAGVAADHGTALEINANPRRLDLSGQAVKTAIEAGASVVIDTDAHQPANYELLPYGVHTARRGWAEPDDVVNTRDASDLRSFLT